QMTDGMATANCLSSSQINGTDNEKLVKPKTKLHALLQHAGADKDIFTMKEIMFYLGQYIMDKQLYDKKQQHIVHCTNDLLGDVLGVNSFSVKEPRNLYALISKNLIAVKNEVYEDSQTAFTELRSQSEPDRGPQEFDSEITKGESNRASADASCSYTAGRRRRRSSDPETSTDEELCDRRKRHKSDSISLTFDESLSWCIIGGLRRDSVSSESSDSRDNADLNTSTGEDSESSFSHDSDSDNFSVEFEVESIYSDTYSLNDETSELTDADDEVYEVTIFEADNGDDSFDEDTEISEADYWKCARCDELNPPLPRHCNRCWGIRQDWFPESDADPKSWESKSSANAAEDKCSREEGVDVPDGKRSCSEPPCDPKQDSCKEALVMKSCVTSMCESQETLCSQPSTSSSGTALSQEEVPELERQSSLDSCLPQSCVDPCVICQSRPKNGCIVHGRTGHLMACYTCAKKLKKRNKQCPVCRQPIQSVVLTYFS
uniref:E3 ubiquitin-protein ligase Mdm2 n=1 Tax=Lepisosteus oculatus TaxID=7918 RepID=W5NH41_LEPOC